MNWWDQIQTGAGDALVNMQSPFGFAPPGMDRQAMIRQSMLNIGTGILANGNQNPLVAAGRGYQMAQEQGADNAMKSYAAKQMMDSAEEKRKEREAQAQQQAAMEEAISQLPPDQQAMARMMPEKFFGEQISQQFATRGTPEFGLNLVPLVDETGKFAGMGQPSKGGGIFLNGKNIAESGLMPMDPNSLAEARASGSLEGSAPKKMVEEYTTKIRPAMIQTAEALSAVSNAKQLIPKIQAGSGAEIAQAIRGWGATMGLNVDESVLSDTQAYQNFIGNIVIPKMQQLGGNDSNEEMRKMYSLSGGDITQAREALALTIEYTDKLLRQRMAQYKAQEEFVLPYLRGLPSVEQVPSPGASGGSDGEVTYNPETGEFE